MPGCDWEMSVGGKQEAELWMPGNKPLLAAQGLLRGRALWEEEVEDWGCSDFGL